MEVKLSVPLSGEQEEISTSERIKCRLGGDIFATDCLSPYCSNDYLTAFFDMGVLGPAETKSISFQYLFDGSAFDERTLPAPTRGTIVILGSTSIP